MRNIERINKVTNVLKEAWSQPGFNDMRFGQFMSNFLGWCVSTGRCNDIWFPEEDKWEQWLKEYTKIND